MNKVINGKRYNVKTAKKLGVWYNQESVTSHSYTYETLYRKRTGEYFLHGEGGGNTRYARRLRYGGFTFGEGIVPLTLEEAKEWAVESRMTWKEIKEEFGEVEV